MTLREFLEEDEFAKHAGIELLEIQTGYAKAKMPITPMHLNAGKIVQGGAIFTLADLTFAAAVNAYGTLTISVDSDIRFFKGVGEGVLFAEAKEVHLHHKLATFEVKVTNEKDELIALFTATGYRKNIPLAFD
jgi:uncharacterized domain 1